MFNFSINPNPLDENFEFNEFTQDNEEELNVSEIHNPNFYELNNDKYSHPQKEIGNIPGNGYIICEEGEYNFTNNVEWGTSGNTNCALVINSSNVTLKFNGFKLSSDNSQNVGEFGIIVMPNLENVVLKDGCIENFGTLAIIVLGGVEHIKLENMDCKGNGHNGVISYNLYGELPISQFGGGILFYGNSEDKIKYVDLENVEVRDSETPAINIGILLNCAVKVTQKNIKLRYLRTDSSVIGIMQSESEILDLDNILINDNGSTSTRKICGVVMINNKCSELNGCTMMHNKASDVFTGIEYSNNDVLDNKLCHIVNNLRIKNNEVTNEEDPVKCLFIGAYLHSNVKLNNCDISCNSLSKYYDLENGEFIYGMTGFRMFNYVNIELNNCNFQKNTVVNAKCRGFTFDELEEETSCVRLYKCDCSNNCATNGEIVGFGGKDKEDDKIKYVTIGKCSALFNDSSLESIGFDMSCMEHSQLTNCVAQKNTVGFSNANRVNGNLQRNLVKSCSACDNQTGFHESDLETNNVYLANESYRNEEENYDGDWFTDSQTAFNYFTVNNLYEMINPSGNLDLDN